MELWWALQLERRYTKDEILEIYLNTMVMGTGVYGVEAASKYFFGHSARELSLAEAAILVIQLSSPARYDPYRNPNAARSRSRGVLESMVAFKYATREDVVRSFDEFWDNFDYTRISAGAFLSRDDKAPWFSEYVRRQLEEMLYGSLDLYTDGFSVYTTLDLDKQALADSYMAGGLAQANAQYKRASSQRLGEAERTFIPILEMLGLAFNQESFRASDSRTEFAAQEMYRDRINPLLDATALLFGIPDLKSLTNAGFGRLKTELERTVVEGALVTIENETGHITSMVGGSRFDQSNQLIRATQARLMPGSTFKPLYYSAALDSGRFTQASLLYDAPVVFYTADGNPYMPLNFKGEWKGPVLLWQALARSMNIPSLKVLDAIGFDAAIARAASLLDITDPAEIRSTFPRVYPLGLGVIGTTPLKMARAFSVFANGGSTVTPIAIRSVEDRTGAVILEPEKDLRRRQAQNAERNRVVSSVNAALIVDKLERVVKSGTLAGQTAAGTSFRQQKTDGSSYIIPAGGKTGTTDNWADAWTVGFTPYLTTAIWFGFDRPGNSLGVEQTGALLAGTIWANYMRDIHRGMPPKEFPKPHTGLATMTDAHTPLRRRFGHPPVRRGNPAYRALHHAYGGVRRFPAVPPEHSRSDRGRTVATRGARPRGGQGSRSHDHAPVASCVAPRFDDRSRVPRPLIPRNSGARRRAGPAARPGRRAPRSLRRLWARVSACAGNAPYRHRSRAPGGRIRRSRRRIPPSSGDRRAAAPAPCRAGQGGRASPAGLPRR